MKSLKRPVTYFLNSIFQKRYLSQRGCCWHTVAWVISKAIAVLKGRLALPEEDITLLQLKNTSRTLYVKHRPNISVLKLLKSKSIALLPV